MQGFQLMELSAWPLLLSAAVGFGYLFWAEWRGTTIVGSVRDLLRKPTPEPEEQGPEWEVIAYHGETGGPLGDPFNRLLRTKRFPQTIRNKRTGEIREIAHPNAGREPK